MMARLFGLLLLLTFSIVSSGQEFQDLIKKSLKKRADAERELKHTLDKIVKKYDTDEYDSIFLVNLKFSQEAWESFKKADVYARYPDFELGLFDADAINCVNDYLTDFTNERTQKLQVWLTDKGFEDKCAGSVMRKE